MPFRARRSSPDARRAWARVFVSVLSCAVFAGARPVAAIGQAEEPDSLPPDGQSADTLPEQIPGYETTVRYLRSLRARASVPGDTTPGRDMGTGLDLGLVVNETQSPTGQDFFDIFYSAWEPPKGVRSFTVRVQEQPIQGLYTRVLILLDDEPLIQIPLQPRRAYIEDMARRAAAYVREELRQQTTGPGRAPHP